MPRARARKTTVRKTKSAKKEEKNVENESIVEETVEETMNDTDDQKMENQSEDASIDTDANQIEESEHNGFEVQEEDLKEENKVQEEDDDFDEDEMEIKDEINPSESKNETSSNVSDKSSPTSKKDSRNESRRHRHDSQEKEIKDKDYDESYFKRMHKRAMGKFHDPTDKGEKINLEEIIKEDFALKEIPPQFKHHLKRLTKIVILDSNDKKIKDIIFTRCTNLSQYLLFILRFTDVSQELFPCLEEVFKCNRPAIGVCLAKACRYHQTLQNEFVTAICKAFDCDSSKNKQIDVVSKILFFEHQFQKPTRNRENNYSIWLYGSLMLQHMFYYAKTYKISKSLLALQPYNLIKICIDRSGSHLIESFLNSSTVELKYKSEFVERYKFY
ncbi:hypothetical protein QR98_0035860 [Sarcoptes scabiei]|uniref:Uncharacterized protein n=1 Tax=Sarcoptes scabiei TaxID=52283 RepID=A0A132A2A1_SARSC|nr:hypothetical protein QR98_0035860 [Sarcoptes scabiei]